MTDQQFTVYTPPTGYQPATLKPGDTLNLWCGKCNRKTDHVWKPGTARPLECVRCYPQVEAANVRRPGA